VFIVGTAFSLINKSSFFIMLNWIVAVGPFVRSEDEEAEVKSVEVGDKVKLSVSDLSPATNYTLLVYAENSFGRSPAAFTLYAHTKGKKFRANCINITQITTWFGAVIQRIKNCWIYYYYYYH